MKKKVITICMIACLVLASSVFAYAEMEDGSILPMANYHSLSNAALTISSVGVAEVSGKIYGISGVTTKTTVHLYLQRKENGEWVNVEDWLSSNNSVNTFLTKTKTVSKGYTYRAKASCYAYCGAKNERVISYSDEIKY